jgi:probable rRNA maturation factor
MIEVYLENQQDKLEVTDELCDVITKAAEQVLEYEGCEFGAEVSVTLVDNDSIKEINHVHRQLDAPTDVLSFPMLEFDEDGNAINAQFDIDIGNDYVILGDIVISLERAAEQAMEYGHSFRREVAFLTVHSMLHLLGYDHVDDEEKAEDMRAREKAVLIHMGIPRE